MKKIFLFFSIFWLLFCLSEFAFGAGSDISFAARVDVVTHTGARWVEFTATCTADDTDGTYPDTQIPGDLRGYKLYSVGTYPGGTGPTADSDLTITEGSASGEDILGGAGVDQIDTSTDNVFKPLVGSTGVDVPIYRSSWIQIDNNSVNDAVVVIILKFIQ